eukprot:s1444_g11.t1
MDIRASPQSRGRWRDAVQELDDGLHEALEITESAFNRVISPSLGAPWHRVAEVFSALTFSRLEASVITVNAAVATCGKALRWNVGVWLLQSMPCAALEPNVISFNSSISACERGGNWPRAVHLLRDMAARHIAPTTASFNSSMSTAEKGAQWELALQLFPDLASQDGAERTCLPALSASVPVSQPARKPASGREQCSFSPGFQQPELHQTSYL